MSKGWTSERGGIIGVLFPIDMGNYARNSVGICEVFTRLNAASQSVRFVAYHWRRSGNFCFTADRGVNLQSVVQLGQDVTGLMCVVRTLDELKLVLAAVPPTVHREGGPRGRLRRVRPDVRWRRVLAVHPARHRVGGDVARARPVSGNACRREAAPRSRAAVPAACHRRAVRGGPSTGEVLRLARVARGQDLVSAPPATRPWTW